MIAIVDYGMGNLRSVSKALEASGATVTVTQECRAIEKASKLILPGVGAFDDARQNLEKLGLIEPILKAIRGGTPFLGLCLGLQLLFSVSEEGGEHAGFDLVPGRVRLFPASGLKVPHIGWNRVTFEKRDCPLLKGIADGSYFYFVHSYYVDPLDGSVVAARSSYGIPFTSVLWRENLFATQFHPEKSQSLGLQLLRNFVAL